MLYARKYGNKYIADFLDLHIFLEYDFLVVMLLTLMHIPNFQLFSLNVKFLIKIKPENMDKSQLKECILFYNTLFLCYCTVSCG